MLKLKLCGDFPRFMNVSSYVNFTLRNFILKIISLFTNFSLSLILRFCERKQKS